MSHGGTHLTPPTLRRRLGLRCCAVVGRGALVRSGRTCAGQSLCLPSETMCTTCPFNSHFEWIQLVRHALFARSKPNASGSLRAVFEISTYSQLHNSPPRLMCAPEREKWPRGSRKQSPLLWASSLCGAPCLRSVEAHNGCCEKQTVSNMLVCV